MSTNTAIIRLRCLQQTCSALPCKPNRITKTHGNRVGSGFPAKKRLFRGSQTGISERKFGVDRASFSYRYQACNQDFRKGGAD